MTADAFDYLPEEIRDRIPEIYGSQDQADPTVWVKLFTPEAAWTWYVTEWDREDTCFGYVVGHEPELGYFNLAELREVRERLGLRVERDLHFEPRPLSRVRVAESPPDSLSDAGA